MLPRILEGLVESPADTTPPLVGPAGPGRATLGDTELINLASCDYLGFARDPAVIGAAVATITAWGLGTAATRVLSGSTVLHRELEARLADWVGTEDSVLFGSCWTANAAVFEALAGFARRAGTTLAVFSDLLNHASIIDGVRAQRDAVSALELFDHQDLAVLAEKLGRAGSKRIKVVVTDGVFSMEGDQAPLAELVRLARDHEVLLVVDDSHGVGVAGETGRGTAQAQGVLGEVDIVTGTLGKALGGAGGGFVATNARLAAALRATARPFIFSNNPATPAVAAALAALSSLEEDPRPLVTMRARAAQLRAGITRLGLSTVGGQHPIVPVLIGSDGAAREASAALRGNGVLATALSHPIVPRNEARLRLQVSAQHSAEDIGTVLHALGSWLARGLSTTQAGAPW